MHFQLNIDKEFSFNGKAIKVPKWSARLEKGLLVEWPILMKFNGQYNITIAEWGIAPDIFASCDELAQNRGNNVGFFKDCAPQGSEKCLILSDQGLVAGYAHTWVDIMTNYVTETFAFAAEEEEHLVISEATALAWLEEPGKN